MTVKTYEAPAEKGEDGAVEEGKGVEVKKVLLWDRKSEGGFPGMLCYPMSCCLVKRGGGGGV